MSAKLGAAYNVFDGEELLWRSIESIRPVVQFVAVVYQTTSNFGDAAASTLIPTLQALEKRGLIDKLVFYSPQTFDVASKRALVSESANPLELGGSPDDVSNQFFNELTKRELGRLECLKAGCTHFMSMDTDEFYFREQLQQALDICVQRKLVATSCRMRHYFKTANFEMLPYDEVNQVPLIHVCTPDHPMRICHPYPCIVDPTRRVSGIWGNSSFFAFPREQIEMHHYTFVRRDIKCKMRNVSNRDNHDGAKEFLRRFDQWKPLDGVIHPHPHGRRTFKFLPPFIYISHVPNYFSIDVTKSF